MQIFRPIHRGGGGGEKLLRVATSWGRSSHVPDQVTWTEAAQPWDHVDPTSVSFPRMPT